MAAHARLKNEFSTIIAWAGSKAVERLHSCSGSPKLSPADHLRIQKIPKSKDKESILIYVCVYVAAWYSNTLKSYFTSCMICIWIPSFTCPHIWIPSLSPLANISGCYVRLWLQNCWHGHPVWDIKIWFSEVIWNMALSSLVFAFLLP